MPDDDFQIEVGEAVRRHILRKSNPLSDPKKAVVAYDSPDRDAIPVFIEDKCLQTMERQALADKEHEIGGVLLGAFYRNDEGSFVEVTDYVEATTAKGTDVSLTFTHETWELIHSKIAQRGDDNLQIVGWYHSHPGLGVFLSKDDEFIHASYFSDPWHVAIVHDPIYTNWGCFKWTDGELERAGGFYIYSDKSHGKQIRDYVKKQQAMRQAPPRSASSSADRLIRPSFVKAPSIWTALIVMLLIQVLVGWYFLSRPGIDDQVDHHETAVQMLKCSNLQGAQEQLRMELAAHPDNTKAYRDLLALNRAIPAAAAAYAKTEDMDRQNMILAVSDQIDLAHNGESRSKSTVRIQTQQQEFRWGDKGLPATTDFVTDDPLKMVLKTYETAAASRAERIGRAKAVRAAVRTYWARDAVTWLEQESLRQIAYGKRTVPLEYQDQYKKLTDEQKTFVDRVLRKKK